ncbi:MAG: hypothetical protein JXB10_07435 [Pirellulales bacterium]|nr:hypothetical protein [Pirellulales bacterium]
MTRPPADENLWEALEVCRPDRDDMPDPALDRLVREMSSHPDLRERYDRILGFDARLAELFRDVPVPPGLAERIHSRLAVDASSYPPGDVCPEAETKSDVVPSILRWGTTALPAHSPRDSSPRRRAVSRRWFVAAGGLLASAVTVLLALYFGLPKTETYTPEDACFAAIRFFEHDEAGPGKLLEEEPPPEKYVFSPVVTLQRGIRWRKISDFLGREGVAYDFPSRGGIRATLYVVSPSIDGIPSIPSLSPYTTGGCAADVWHEDGRLYVLVIQGSTQNFRSFFRSSRSSLALVAEEAAPTTEMTLSAAGIFSSEFAKSV